jgi:hypothetical protein
MMLSRSDHRQVMHASTFAQPTHGLHADRSSSHDLTVRFIHIMFVDFSVAQSAHSSRVAQMD